MTYGWSGRGDALTYSEKQAILARDDHTCQIRGPRCTLEGVEVDHIMNLAAGGTNDPSNLQAACKPCHLAKSRIENAAALKAKAAMLRHPTEPHPGLK